MTSALLLPNVLAQDYTQWSLPEDAYYLGKGCKVYINEIAFSPDGTWLAVATSIGCYIYDVCTGKSNLLDTTQGTICSLCYSPDGGTLAAGIWDNTVCLWDTHTGRQIQFLRGHRHWVHSVCYSPDGKTLASGSSDGTVRLWDTHTGRQIRILRGHRHWVHSVCYSPDGKTLASGSSDGTVRLWDMHIHIGLLRRTLKRHEDIVWSVCYSSDGKTLASGSFDGTVRLWDTHTGRQIRILRGHRHWVHSVCYSPDGKTLASGSSDDTIRLWDTHIGQPLRTFTGHRHQVNSVCYSPDGKTLASGSSDGTILLRNIPQVVSPYPQSSLVPKQKTPQQVAEDALAATVLVVMEDANGQTLSTGSGFFVAHNLIATNLHVVKGALSGYVKRVGMDTTYRIEGIVAMDSSQDLVLIRSSDVVGASVLPLGSSAKVQIGESVYVAGNPMRFLEGTFSDGIVSGVREFRVGRERIQITAPISEGSSGGPVLNGRGEVIGVAVSTITAGQNLNFAIPSNYLIELLNKVKERR